MQARRTDGVARLPVKVVAESKPECKAARVVYQCDMLGMCTSTGQTPASFLGPIGAKSHARGMPVHGWLVGELGFVRA